MCDRLENSRNDIISCVCGVVWYGGAGWTGCKLCEEAHSRIIASGYFLDIIAFFAARVCVYVCASNIGQMFERIIGQMIYG